MFTKKIVAGAALLALAAAAQAQVKVYGSVEATVGSFKTATAGSKAVTKVDSGQMMTSFLGFSGSEDLGGGLKAEFVLETFLATDTGGVVPNNAGQYWGRGSNVALSGGFGKIALGQYDNALFTYGYTYNPFGSSMGFSPTMRHFYSLGSLGNAKGAALGVDTGWVNSITYETPTVAGFAANLQVTPKETSAAGAKNSVTVGASYNAGAFSAGLAYMDADDQQSANTAAGTAFAKDQKVTSLGASYDFGVVKAFGQYTAVNNAVAADETIFQVGASAPVTAAGTVLASYGQYKTKNGGSKDTIFSLGYDHMISKRTDVYAVISNEKVTNVKAANSFAVGIKHNF
ncbi:porin [Aquabacterium lacunae]|uniref:Porin n=1 Tax=Aquabacterium lacunae TaxID=2528630 RepID=A0A4Q9H444_9BURK|nr:porin [Aquabacterium lacunae]TBO31296.1 porin [Aquabacterium lacunae]